MSPTRPREEVSSTGGLQGQEGTHLHLSLLLVSVGFFERGWVQVGGAKDLSAQHGVNFSVVISLVLFLYVESGGGLVGVVALCGGVELVG